MIEKSLSGLSGNVKVETFKGLLVEYAKAKGAVAILRGLRSALDFEYELQMAVVNHQLEPEVQSLFMMPEPKWSHLSSTLVKEVASLGADISAMVPPAVADALRQKLKNIY